MIKKTFWRLESKMHLIRYLSTVHVKLDKPIDALGYKQIGDFREGDFHWDKTPRKILRILHNI